MSERFKIVIADVGFPDAEIEQQILSRIGGKIYKYQTTDEDEVVRITKDADVVFCDAAPITGRVFARAKKLKQVVEYGVGYDNIDVEAATEAGILVCNAPHYMTSELPDHAVSLGLALFRKVLWADSDVKSGVWNWERYRPTYNLSGLTAGVIGLGRLGKMVARRYRALEMRVIAYDPYVGREDAEAAGAQLIDLKTLLKESDIVSIHTLLTKETFHLIGEKELGLMKKSAILINTARGKIIDQNALCSALATKKIAAAGLDVLEKEPPDPNDPILKLDNIIITPHMAFYSETSINTLRVTVAEEALRFLSGQMPRHPVNPQILGRRIP